ncbi:hypothetical protein ACHAWF_014523 [Thalassiosira exigua]
MLLNIVKFTYSTSLLLFSLSCVIVCIFLGQTAAAGHGISPPAAFTCFGLLLGWLAVAEGGQGCLVGLKGVQKSRFKVSHPITYKCCKIAHRNDNLERFIVGRQFLVVLILFGVNLMGDASSGANVLNMPSWMASIFLDSSLAIIVTTISFAQLPAQVTAAVAMLDFLQNYFMLGTVGISLFIEASGLLHAVYLLQMLFSRMSGSVKEATTKNSPMQTVLFWIRVVLSLSILSLAFAVTIKALLLGKSGMWEGVSPALSILIFIAILAVVGLMEGVQIAAFALLNLSQEELIKSPIAHSNCDLMFGEDGANLKKFLVGRQILVASLMFIVARIATIQLDEGDENIFGVNDLTQSFLNTGLLGAVILTIFGSLAWRVAASSQPLAYMSNPVISMIVKICFGLEATGICSASWLIALAMRAILRLKPDHEYLGGVGDAEVPEKVDVKQESKRTLFKARKRASSVKSSKVLSVDTADELDDRVDKLESSIARFSRSSAVLSHADIAAVADEMGEEFPLDDSCVLTEGDEESVAACYELM